MKVAAIAAATLATVASAAPDATKKLFSLTVSSTDSRFNGKCVTSYHTGAGLGAATLVPCDSKEKLFYMNGTALAWTGFGNDISAGFQTSGSTSDYTDWIPATINTGAGTSGLTYNSTSGFISPDNTGYIVCRWSLGGTPQVFTKTVGSPDITLANCAQVKLLKAF